MKLHVILPLFTLSAGVKYVRDKSLVADADKTESGTEVETRQASKLAVLISGLEDSFNWAHAVDRVIRPAARQGFTLDFYIRLVARGRSNGAEWSQIKDETVTGVDVNAWKQNVIATNMEAAGSKSGAGTDQSEFKEHAGSDQSEVKQSGGSAQSEANDDEGSDQSEVKEVAGSDQNEVEEDVGSDQSDVKEDAGSDQSVSEEASTDQRKAKEEAGTDQNEVKEEAGNDRSEVNKERTSQVDTDEMKKAQSKRATSQGLTIPDLAERADSEWSSFLKDLDSSHVALAQSWGESYVRSTSWKEALAQLPGSQVKSFELINNKEQIVIPPHAPTKLSQYSPVNTKIGRNLLRRFKSIEDLWHKALGAEKDGHFRYKFVMVAREDPTWMSPLNMNIFNTVGSQNVVFSKKCLSFGGLNDKAFVFGRLAAEKSLTRLYTEFWNSSVEAPNAEQYWKFYTASKGIQSVLVDPTKLATSDTKWQFGKPCQTRQYHCEAAYEQQPAFCESKNMKAGCDCSWTTGVDYKGGVVRGCGGKGDGSFCWNNCCEEFNPIAKAAVKAAAEATAENTTEKVEAAADEKAEGSEEAEAPSEEDTDATTATKKAAS